jgi:hypothetical protein
MGLQLPDWSDKYDYKIGLITSAQLEKPLYAGDCVAFGNDDVLLPCLIYPGAVES